MILYNTLTRTKEKFTPFDKNRVTLYACGPTVYDYAHVGHLRAYIFVDTLARVIRYNGYPLTHVMNITDVGHLTDDADGGVDKVEEKARRERRSVWDTAHFYTEDFFATTDALSIYRPDIVCKATDHIAEMIALIERIEGHGFAYRITDGIYFDTSRLSDYGKLALLDRDHLKEGARVEPNPEKRNAGDFALWKFSPVGAKRQMEWDSPWGTGFPGWHIECTAMAVKYLREQIDIHTGGIDHIPVHHTNEIAQAQGAFGKDVVRVWLHNEFVLVDGEKMSKSKGNFYRLRDVTDRGISPRAVRYFFLQAHYRSPVNFTWEAVKAAQHGFERLCDKVKSLKFPARGGSARSSRFAGETGGKTQNHNLKLKTNYAQLFLDAVNDDLNTPQALAVLWDMLRDESVGEEERYARALDFDKVLGLGLADIKRRESSPLPPEIQKLAASRARAREAKNFEESDALRREIQAMGYEVTDTTGGQVVTRS